MNRLMRCAGSLALAVVLQGYGEAGHTDDRTGWARGHHGRPVTGAELADPASRLPPRSRCPTRCLPRRPAWRQGRSNWRARTSARTASLPGKMFERTSPVDGKTYAIAFEMRLPLEWNGRFFYQANGGIDGSVVTATGNTSGGGPLTSALLQG